MLHFTGFGGLQALAGSPLVRVCLRCGHCPSSAADRDTDVSAGKLYAPHRRHDPHGAGGQAFLARPICGVRCAGAGLHDHSRVVENRKPARITYKIASLLVNASRSRQADTHMMNIMRRGTRRKHGLGRASTRRPVLASAFRLRCSYYHDGWLRRWSSEGR